MSTKDYSSLQEKKIARLLGWSVVAASGARRFHPGDIRSDEWLGECKTHVTAGSKIVFKTDVWNKLVEEAKSEFKFPVYISDDGSQEISRTWCMFNPVAFQLPATSSSTDVSLQTIPTLSGKASISFIHEDMMKTYQQFASSFPYIVVYLGSRRLALMPIVPFSKYVNIH